MNLAQSSGHPALDTWDALLNSIAPKYNVPPNLAKAHMEYESDGDPTVIGSSGRGCGLMQIDYGTYWNGEVWCYTGPNGTTDNIMDPETNILIACRDFIKPNIDAFGINNLDAVIAAYNAGIGPVMKAIKDGTPLTKVTFRPWYISSVEGAYRFFEE